MFVFIRVYVRLQFLILSSFISVRMNKVGRYKASNASHSKIEIKLFTLESSLKKEISLLFHKLCTSLS